SRARTPGRRRPPAGTALTRRSGPDARSGRVRPEPGPQRGRSRGEHRPQPRLVNPPEVMLLSVDEGDGDLLGVPPLELVVVEDVAFVPRHIQLAADASDDLARLVAQVAARLAQQYHPWLGRRTFGHRMTIPSAGDVSVRGPPSTAWWLPWCA